MKGRESMGERERERERENESQPQSRGARSLIITSLNLIDVVPTTGKERGRGGRRIKRRGTYYWEREGERREKKEGRVMLKGDRKYTVIVTI